MDDIKREAGTLLTSLQVLNGSGLPSKVQKVSQRIGYTDKTEWRKSTDVDYHAGKVLEWLKNCRQSKLRSVVNIMSVAGVTYNASVEHQCLMAYCKHGGGEAKLADDAKARLCQSGEPKRAAVRETYEGIF